MFPKAKKSPQKGNPHQLTRNQHTFPARSIERFYSDEMLVNMCIKSRQKKFWTDSRDQGFCAKFVWDQIAESGFMKRIEDDFQRLISNLQSRSFMAKLTPVQYRTIHEMYCLWHLRVEAAYTPSKSQQLNDLAGLSFTPTEDDIERAEKGGVTLIDGDFCLSDRHMTSIDIHRGLLDYMSKFMHIPWGVLVATDVAEEFLVPDTFNFKGIMPVSPKVCFILGEASVRFVGRDEVADINSLARESMIDFCFARNLEKCP